MKIGNYEVFALFALTLLLASILLVGINIPTEATDSEPIYLHGPALNSIHMHSNITLTPIHMHFTGPELVDPISTPVCTSWHELYPEYSQSWHLTDWEDHGDGLLSPCDQISMTNINTEKVEWYHVDRITYTLNLSSMEEPSLRMFVEFKGPPEVDPILNPVCTFWHEVYPNYSNVYHIINASGPLEPCTTISLEQWINGTSTGNITIWHVDGVATDIILRWKMTEPIGTWWHELYPEYSKWYNLTSWEDNNGDGFPTPCDQIDMTEKESETEIWYNLDRATITINVTTVAEPIQWMMLELKIEELEYMFYFLQYPLYSLWHEVYPNYCNVYNLTWWDPMETDNCNGVLDPCDYIGLLNMTSGEEQLYHIEDMSYDIILNKKITNPVCTMWHEIYPEYCREYHIQSWEDNGDGLLSPCDQITMGLMPEELTAKYHVENVSITLNLTSWTEPVSFMLIEPEAPFEVMYWPKIDPYGGVWHEVYPSFCTEYLVTEWEDNCNGVLSSCDNLTLMNIEDEVITFWHVEEVAVDMVVTKTPIHDVAVINVSSLYPQVEQGEIDPINVTVENQGDYTENVTVYAFYNETLAAPHQTVTLNPGENVTLTFNWNTTGITLGSYTISANATITIDDDPEDNVFVDGTQKVIPEFPSIVFLPLLMALSLIITAFKRKERKR